MARFSLPVEIHFGDNQISNLSMLMAQKGLGKAMIIADPFIAGIGLADKIMAASEGRIIGIVSDVEPNPSIHNAEKCAEKARELSAECLISIGGGSTIDCTKTVGVMVHDNCSAIDLLNGHTIKGCLPIVAIPTTSGTSADLTAVSVLSWKEKGIKAPLISNHLFAKLSIVDPVLTYTCPPDVTATTGIDVLAHALDALTSVKSQPASDVLAVEASRLVFKYLPIAYKDGNNIEAREEMSKASMLAGMAFSQTGTTGSHACSYILTSKYRIPHGEACAMTLDLWWTLDAKVKPGLEELGKKIGFESSAALAEALNALKSEIGLRTYFDEAGIPEKDIPEIAAATLAAINMPNNPVILTQQEMESFLQKKFR